MTFLARVEPREHLDWNRLATSAIHPEQTFAPSAFRNGTQGLISGVGLISAPDPSWTISAKWPPRSRQSILWRRGCVAPEDQRFVAMDRYHVAGGHKCDYFFIRYRRISPVHRYWAMR
jgi:hypothetical protein